MDKSRCFHFKIAVAAPNGTAGFGSIRILVMIHDLTMLCLLNYKEADTLVLPTVCSLVEPYYIFDLVIEVQELDPAERTRQGGCWKRKPRIVEPIPNHLWESSNQLNS